MNQKRITTRHRCHLKEVRRMLVFALEDGRIEPHERAEIFGALDGADAGAAVIDITDGLRATSAERVEPVLVELGAWIARLPEGPKAA